MLESAIVFEKLGHAYRPGQWIFRNLAASLDRGKIFAVLGANGCGKTTLLQLALGLFPPAEGRVRVQGRTAFVPQQFQLSFEYSVLEVVLMGRAKKIGLFSQPSREDEEMARAALARFGLDAYAQRPFHELSGGMRQLAVFARALVAEAEILVLDEPTSALDLKNQSLVLEWILRLSRDEGLTVLFTTHHPHHALAAADEALLMLGEEAYACGPVGEVLTEPRLLTAYGVEMKRLTFEHGGRRIETLAPVFGRYR